MTSQRIRVKLRSFDAKLLDQSAAKIVATTNRSGATVAGPVPLPTKIEKYCVLRSPHVNKKSREQFEIRTHKRLIDIINPNEDTIEALMKLELPAGISVDIKS
ncbi:MAG: 30S ribosomal protein S10 [Spirochaetes bacterium]|nr:30S ribosomal protein S10 [Spirochaetota bacterium]